MKKDIEWVKEEISDIEHKIEDELYTEDTDFRMTTRLSGMIDVLQEIKKVINQLDKPETLSKKWIDENKKYNNVHDIGYYIPVDKLYGKIVPKQEVTIGKEDTENIVQYKEMGWTLSHLINDYGEDARHDELLAKAWLAYPNIVVEEEQKYIVSDNSSIPLLIKNDSGEIMSYDSQIAYNNSNGTIELTEQEIKSYDERYMAFAKPVEEVEAH